MKLLFISHETERTGAPMVLLYFLQWLQKHHTELVVDVVGLQGGSLEPDFKNACHTYYDYRKMLKPRALTRLQRLLVKLNIYKKPHHKALFLNMLAENNYRLIYANTIKTIPLASDIIRASPKSKLLVHIHELNTIIKITLPDFKDYIPIINQFIVPSNLAKTNLTTSWEIPSQKIDVVYECTQISQSTISLTTEKDHVFTVGASGTVHWRKGHDVFLQVARYIKYHYPDITLKFVWVGAISVIEKSVLEEDILKMELGDMVSFVEEQKNPMSLYNEFDVFLMTSREDPFPLVCIEVGILGKPIICFEGATGTEEIMKDGGGIIVPYLNIERMAESIIEYYNNPNLVKIHGAFNQKVFLQFTPEVICPEYFKIIEQEIIN